MNINIIVDRDNFVKFFLLILYRTNNHGEVAMIEIIVFDLRPFNHALNGRRFTVVLYRRSKYNLVVSMNVWKNTKVFLSS